MPDDIQRLLDELENPLHEKLSSDEAHTESTSTAEVKEQKPTSGTLTDHSRANADVIPQDVMLALEALIRPHPELAADLAILKESTKISPEQEELQREADELDEKARSILKALEPDEESIKKSMDEAQMVQNLKRKLSPADFQAIFIDERIGDIY
eukprot:CAMPEP_0113945130 /NCGR_PEP_ID=MMETSP1339-20121228/38503_1 /TAXON_ID=94617 /ORGANISM="Fibrocapsa japonica" /LENGTH=154 /DNA_ID=CAMNT_0000950545 /DNA_START=222 /DNA_END=686 /DNA_ORIENTATION=- /assembly_acc=CAM_ASM_000762